MIQTLPSFPDVLAARDRIQRRIRHTPMLEITEALVGRGIAGRWWIKVESLQVGGAFKIRGALARLTAWMESGELPVGLVTYSSGNHGLAVTLAARDLGLPVAVAVPETIPRAKLDGLEQHGAEVVLAGTTSAHRREAAHAFAAHRGYSLVEPFDDPMIVAGQGTMALEMLDDLPEITDCVVPVGGGGLLAGVGMALDSLKPDVRLHAVEPEGCDSFRQSRARTACVHIEPGASLADGLRPTAPGEVPFAIANPLVHACHVVNDDHLLTAMRFLQHPLHLVAEPSGAATLAALLAGSIATDPTTRGVLVLSGGNCDWVRLARHLWS